MPGKNISNAAPLSSAEIELRGELIADVQTLAGQIGERNMARYPQLNAAADFIENSFSRAGLQPRRDSYDLNGRACHNIEAEIPAAQGTRFLSRRRSSSSARITIRCSDRPAPMITAAALLQCLPSRADSPGNLPNTHYASSRL